MRRFIAMGIRPSDDYRPPYWWNVAQAAKYYGCHPQEIMTGSTFWVDVALACSDIEQHAREVAQQRSR